MYGRDAAVSLNRASLRNLNGFPAVQTGLAPTWKVLYDPWSLTFQLASCLLHYPYAPLR